MVYTTRMFFFLQVVLVVNVGTCRAQGDNELNESEKPKSQTNSELLRRPVTIRSVLAGLRACSVVASESESGSSDQTGDNEKIILAAPNTLATESLRDRDDSVLLDSFESGKIFGFVISKAAARELFLFGFPVFTINSELRYVRIASTDEFCNDGVFVTMHLRNGIDYSAISSYLHPVQHLFQRILTIFDYLVKMNQEWLQHLRLGSEVEREVQADINRLEALSQAAQELYPNLHSAFALYEVLRDLAVVGYDTQMYAALTKKIYEEKNTMTQKNTAIAFVALYEYCYVNLIISLLKPFADAFLRYHHHPIRPSLDWQGVMMPYILQEYAQGRYDVRKQPSAQAVETEEESVSRAPKHKRKRKSKKARDAAKRRGNSVVRNEVGAHEIDLTPVTGQSLLADRAGTGYKSDEGHVSPDLPVPLPNANDIVTVSVPQHRPLSVIDEVVEIRSSFQTDEKDDGASTKKAEWKAAIAARRIKKEKSRKEVNKAITEKHSLEMEEKERRQKKDRTSAQNRLLALYPIEQQRFQAFLKRAGVAHGRIYQALLNPYEGKKVTQTELDTFFEKLCNVHLSNFLNEECIGSPEERYLFTASLLTDLLATRHDPHNTGDGSKLVAHYVTHRRIPLIYAGIISLDSKSDNTVVEHVGKDNRAAQEKYFYRLFERAFSTKAEET